MYVFNLGLLSKQGWRFIQDESFLVAKILKAKYYPNYSFMDTIVGKGASFCWRNFFKVREILALGLRWKIGSREEFSIWNDKWVPLPFLFQNLISQTYCLQSFHGELAH